MHSNRRGDASSYEDKCRRPYDWGIAQYTFNSWGNPCACLCYLTLLLSFDLVELGDELLGGHLAGQHQGQLLVELVDHIG
jgi:hypothetical protein